MEWETVKLEGEGAILELVLNRPHVRNAVNLQLIHDISSACDAIERRPECRAVIVRGEGKDFSAGADLKEGLSGSGSQQTSLVRSRAGERMIDMLGEIQPVTIAAIQGHAIGAGACIAMACDFRVGAQSAKVSIREVSLGVSLSWHSIPNAVHLVGPTRAKEMILFADMYDAPTLFNYGFFQQLVQDAELGASARALAERVVRQPPLPAAMTKASVNAYVRALDRSIFHMDSVGVTLTGRMRDAARAQKAFFSGESVQWENE